MFFINIFPVNIAMYYYPSFIFIIVVAINLFFITLLFCFLCTIIPFMGSMLSWLLLFLFLMFDTVSWDIIIIDIACRVSYGSRAKDYIAGIEYIVFHHVSPYLILVNLLSDFCHPGDGVYSITGYIFVLVME